MKRKINFFVYPLAVVLMSLFIVVGCSDDEDEVLPDDPTPGKVYDIDDNEYKTVIIGDQEWMAENLRVTKYNNGDAIPTGLGDEEWESTTSGAYAIYPYTGGAVPDEPVEGINSDEEMVASYGKLYNWYAVDDSRGLCPEGWSVPSTEDFWALTNYVIDQGFSNSNVVNGAGNALKSCRQVGSPLGGECNTSTHPRWNSDDTHYGFDEFGFSALPGGLRAIGGWYFSIGYLGRWWSATEGSGTNAFPSHMLSKYGYMVYQGDFNKRHGFSVRCIRD